MQDDAIDLGKILSQVYWPPWGLRHHLSNSISTRLHLSIQGGGHVAADLVGKEDRRGEGADALALEVRLGHIDVHELVGGVQSHPSLRHHRDAPASGEDAALHRVPA